MFQRCLRVVCAAAQSKNPFTPNEYKVRLPRCASSELVGVCLAVTARENERMTNERTNEPNEYRARIPVPVQVPVCTGTGIPCVVGPVIYCTP